MRSSSFRLLALLSLVLLACHAESAEIPAHVEEAAASAQEPPPDAPAPAPAPERELRAPAIDFTPGGPVSDAQLAEYHVALSCSVAGEDVGTLTIALWPQSAPITVRNFLRLCDVGFYDGLGFHRILREFMVQGGDPTGNGMGDSPFGTIAAEFSEAPERGHGYGVLSMARKGGQPDSASCQFFICCDETPSVWALDGQYASFGKVTSGVKTLEALADVPVSAGMSGEGSVPTKEAKIVRAEVKHGAAPTGEAIERPAPDLKGEPARVLVQHVLISFKGAPRVTAERSQEEAAALAQQVLERARAGEDFAAMARELSDDKVQPGDETPGTYSLRNRGVRNLGPERAFFEAERAAQKEMQELQKSVEAGKATQEELAARRNELVKQLTAAFEALGTPREKMVPGFGDVAFTLQVGEFGMVPHDATKAPYGWHVLKRIE